MMQLKPIAPSCCWKAFLADENIGKKSGDLADPEQTFLIQKNLQVEAGDTPISKEKKCIYKLQQHADDVYIYR